MTAPTTQEIAAAKAAISVAKEAYDAAEAASQRAREAHERTLRTLADLEMRGRLAGLPPEIVEALRREPQRGSDIAMTLFLRGFWIRADWNQGGRWTSLGDHARRVLGVSDAR